MIRSAGNLKSIRTRKNRLFLRGAVGVWNRESSRAVTVQAFTLLALSQELAAGA